MHFYTSKQAINYLHTVTTYVTIYIKVPCCNCYSYVCVTVIVMFL